jgi:carboxypeptidase Taq
MDTRAVNPAKPAYAALTRQQLQIYRFRHFASMAYWDRSSMMPPKGNEARAAALAELEAHIHRLLTDPRQRDALDAAEQEPLDELERANVREIRREWRAATALPESLVQEQLMAAARCEHAWRTQRRANDWKGFLPNLREVMRLAREEARLLSESSGLGRYDAMLDRYEPGMTSADLDRLFGDLKAWLPALAAKVREKQAHEKRIEPVGPFPVARQREMSLSVVKLLGFDFDAGRLDESAHPFNGGVPEDIRMTTRYLESSCIDSLMSTIHETGHARYEQNLPREWLGQPVGRARSSAIHESMSLSFEMQLARSRAFAGLLAPLLAKAYGQQPAFEADNLHRLFTRVKGENLIRVAADECTYPLHVILRYEIERPLIEGAIECEDIPALWEAKMRDYLGLETRGNFENGCMQDVHWSEGLVGYFPTYTLGAMYAAQWFAAIRRAHPDLDERVAAGDPGPAFDWIRANIWSQARLWETAELARRASGESLNPAHFRKHLEGRYLG